MRSSGSPPDDDRTTAARIRDAAIDLFAADGITTTTVRAIAARAGVSPGLVIHHFGSKDGLLAACDRHVAALIREQKRAAMRAGAGYDPLTTMREMKDGPPLTRYLTRTLVDGSSEHVTALVDEMVADAAAYMADGVRSGMLRLSEYPYERAVLLTVWSLGALVLHEHVERLVGVDLTANLVDDPASAAAYTGPALEVAVHGFVNPEVAARMRAALVDGPASQRAQQESDHDGEG
jgi:AcrR family transcriptional regulator